MVVVVNNIPISERDKEETILYLKRQILGWKDFLTKSKDPANRLFADNEIACLTKRINELKG